MRIIGENEIVPGNIIQWVHEDDFTPIMNWDKILSIRFLNYVVIDPRLVHVCVGCDAFHVTFMNAVGVFKLHVSDLVAVDLWLETVDA